MYYKSNYNIEDAVVVEGNTTKDDALKLKNYPSDIIDKVQSMRVGDYSKTLLQKNKTSINVALITTALGAGFAVYKKKNILIFSILGGLSGLAISNLIIKNFSIKKINSNKINDDETKPSA